MHFTNYHVPGDFYIVAVVPVNDRSTNQPLQCGSIRETDGADLVQSLLFAVQEVNRKEGRFSEIFHDKTLGIVVINSCFRLVIGCLINYCQKLYSKSFICMNATVVQGYAIN